MPKLMTPIVNQKNTLTIPVTRLQNMTPKFRLKFSSTIDRARQKMKVPKTGIINAVKKFRTKSAK